jgi:hypothetical protein
MIKEAFAELICMVPFEAIRRLKDHADAERRIRSYFGERFQPMR